MSRTVPTSTSLHQLLQKTPFTHYNRQSHFLTSQPGCFTMANTGVRTDSFPAPSKQAFGTVNGVPTEVSRLSFSDKILIAVSQEGRLSQWVGNLPKPSLHLPRYAKTLLTPSQDPSPPLSTFSGHSGHGPRRRWAGDSPVDTPDANDAPWRGRRREGDAGAAVRGADSQPSFRAGSGGPPDACPRLGSRKG